MYRSFSETESPTSLKTFRRRHNRQDHKENTRVKTSKRNCTLNVREDKTFLWRIDTQPPSYFFGTIHVPYTRVWDAVSDNAKKAFKVYIFYLLYKLFIHYLVRFIWVCGCFGKFNIFCILFEQHWFLYNILHEPIICFKYTNDLINIITIWIII